MINIRTITYNTDMTVFCEFYPDYIFLKRKIELFLNRLIFWIIAKIRGVSDCGSH